MCCAVESLLTAGVEKHVYVLCCGEFIDSWCREMCVCAVLCCAALCCAVHWITDSTALTALIELINQLNKVVELAKKPTN